MVNISLKQTGQGSGPLHQQQDKVKQEGDSKRQAGRNTSGGLGCNLLSDDGAEPAFGDGTGRGPTVEALLL